MMKTYDNNTEIVYYSHCLNSHYYQLLIEKINHEIFITYLYILYIMILLSLFLYIVI